MPTRRSRQDSVGSLGPGPSKKSHVSSANKENNPSDSSLSPEDRRARRAETSALVARVVQMSKEKHMKACASKKSVHAVKPPFVHATTVFVSFCSVRKSLSKRVLGRPQETGVRGRVQPLLRRGHHVLLHGW